MPTLTPPAPEAKARWNRTYYEKNKAAYAERNRQSEQRNLAFLRQVKDVPCMDCGKRYPHYVMDFDHVRGVKVGNLANMARQRVSLKRLQEEIDKCEIVCANCHRERTHMASSSSG